MLVAATQVVAAATPASTGTGEAGSEPDARKGLLPDVVDVREVSVKIAVAVFKAAVEEGVAEEEEIPTVAETHGQRLADDEIMEEWVREQMWEAQYRPLRRVSHVKADKLGRGEAGAARYASQDA